MIPVIWNDGKLKLTHPVFILYLRDIHLNLFWFNVSIMTMTFWLLFIEWGRSVNQILLNFRQKINKTHYIFYLLNIFFSVILMVIYYILFRYVEKHEIDLRLCSRL